MGSRVLPEDLDTTHTLRPAYGWQRPSIEPVASLSNPSLTDGGRGPKLTLRQDHPGLIPINKSSTYSNMPSSGSSASVSFSLSPGSSLNEGLYDGLQYSTSAYSASGSPTITSPFGDELGRLSSFSTSLITQEHETAIRQGSTNRFNAKSLVTPMSISFADIPCSYGETPSRSSPTPVPFSPIYKQSSTQYSPAAGSAGYPCQPVFYTAHGDINRLLSSQSRRMAQFVQSPRPFDRTVDPIQPLASSNIHPWPRGNMNDATLLGQQRPYTEPDP